MGGGVGWGREAGRLWEGGGGGGEEGLNSLVLHHNYIHSYLRGRLGVKHHYIILIIAFIHLYPSSILDLLLLWLLFYVFFFSLQYRGDQRF